MSNQLRVLYLMTSGKTGGIERLCVDISEKSLHNNYFYFFWGGGLCEENISNNSSTVVRHFDYFHILSEFRFFINFVKKNNFDIIVIQFPSPIIMLFSLMASRYSKIVLYLHADPKSLFDTKIKKILLRMIQKNLAGTIAISKFVKSEYFYDKVEVIYNGTNLNKFNYKKNKNNSVIQLIYVGRLVEKKGVQDVFKALKNVRLPWNLTIVGTGDYENKLKCISEEMGFENKVSFVGEQNKVEDWLTDSDLFIHAARCSEGFGITIIESMACGVPCIAYKKGAIPEIITNNDNGFLVTSFNINSLEIKLQEIIDMFYNNYAVFSKVCKNARNRAEEFSIDAYIKKLDNYLEEICDGNQF